MDVPEVLIVVGIAALVAEVIHHWMWRYHHTPHTRR